MSELVEANTNMQDAPTVVDNAPEFVDNTADNNDVSYSSDPLKFIENKAMEAGWKPKEQFEGDPEEWKPAHEFIGQSIDVYRTQLKKHKKTTKAYENLLAFQSKNHAAQKELLQKQLDNAISEKEQALNSYDTDVVRLKDKEIKEVEKALNNLQDPNESIKKQMTETVQVFQKENQNIFNDPKKMHDFQFYANQVEMEMRQEGYSFVTAEEVEHLLELTKKRYQKNNPLQDTRPKSGLIPSSNVPPTGKNEFDRLDATTRRDIEYAVSKLNPTMKKGTAEYRKACNNFLNQIKG